MNAITARLGGKKINNKKATNSHARHLFLVQRGKTEREGGQKDYPKQSSRETVGRRGEGGEAAGRKGSRGRPADRHTPRCLASWKVTERCVRAGVAGLICREIESGSGLEWGTRSRLLF